MAAKPNKGKMLEKGRISAMQFSFLGITLVISTATVFVPGFVAQEAKQDSWLSVIFGSVFSLIVAVLFIILARKYPDKTLFQYSCDILGKFFGKLVGASIVLYLIIICFAVTRELGDIFVTSFNPYAPLLIYSIITVLVAAYAVHQGLEVIARVNQLVLPFGLGVLGLIALVNLKDTDMSNFLPVLENGLLPPLKGAISIQGWLLELFILLQFTPFVKEKKNIGKSFAATIGILGFSMMLGTLTIAVFGSLTSSLLYPALEYVRYANLGQYVKNLDITIMGVWIIGIFIKIVITYYGTVVGISEIFGFKSYKPMIVPVGLLIISLSVSAAERIHGIFNFAYYTFPFYSFSMAFLIPLILIIVSMFRKKKKTN